MPTPPGWYPDPDVPGGLRWYDGAGWTDHRVPPGVGQVGPVPPHPAAGHPPLPGRTGMNPTARVFLILGAVVGGFVLLSMIAAIAVPMFLNQRTALLRAELAEVDCERAAEDAVALSQEGSLAREDGHRLLAVTDPRLVNDRRDQVTRPTPGSQQHLLTCTGMGTWDDDYESTVYLYVSLADDLTLLYELRYD